MENNPFKDFCDLDYYSYSGASNWDNGDKPIIARCVMLDETELDIVIDKEAIQINVLDDDCDVYSSYHSLPKDVMIGAGITLFNRLSQLDKPQLIEYTKNVWRKVV